MLARNLVRLAAGLLFLSSLTSCGGSNSTGSTGSPPPAVYTIGGNLSGLTNGTGALVVLKSGNDTLTLTHDGSFAFATHEQYAFAYDVRVSTQPPVPSALQHYEWQRHGEWNGCHRYFDQADRPVQLPGWFDGRRFALRRRDLRRTGRSVRHDQ